MSESANPPVGATVDALALRIGSAAADWNLYLNSTRGYDPVAPVQNVTDALETAVTALRALVAERDQLKARVVELQEDAALCERTRTNMRNILDAVAEALRGKPEPLHAHGWSDLPARVGVLREALEEIADGEDRWTSAGFVSIARDALKRGAL